jgi:transposase
MMGALDWLSRKLIVTTSRSKRSTDFMTLLQTLDFLYGPKPGMRIKPVVIVLDNGPIHTSKATLAALAARKHWLTVEWLPKYAPELNDIERVWRDLKAHHLAHQTVTDAETLDAAIHQAVAVLNFERNRHPLGNQRISA